MTPNDLETQRWEKVNPKLNDMGETTYGWIPPDGQKRSEVEFLHGLTNIENKKLWLLYLNLAINTGIEVAIICGDDKLRVSKRGYLSSINDKNQIVFSDGSLFAKIDTMLELHIATN